MEGGPQSVVCFITEKCFIWQHLKAPEMTKNITRVEVLHVKRSSPAALQDIKIQLSFHHHFCGCIFFPHVSAWFFFDLSCRQKPLPFIIVLNYILTPLNKESFEYLV